MAPLRPAEQRLIRFGGVLLSARWEERAAWCLALPPPYWGCEGVCSVPSGRTLSCSSRASKASFARLCCPAFLATSGRRRFGLLSLFQRRWTTSSSIPDRSRAGPAPLRSQSSVRPSIPARCSGSLQSAVVTRSESAVGDDQARRGRMGVQLDRSDK